MDQLLQDDDLKSYTFTVDSIEYTGQFYQFNKFKSAKSSDDLAGEIVKEKTHSGWIKKKKICLGSFTKII